MSDRHEQVDGQEPCHEHRAPGLAIVGIVALGVAGWALADGPALPDAGALGWLAVGVGLAIGVLLILSGARSTRS